MPGALTLRQAKAAHKARGASTVSEKEIRQLQREIQLDRRAWAAREREKQRAKISHTRAEEAQRAKAVETALQLGTQRKYDRFGHRSSQFHLGAFFTKASELPRAATKSSAAAQNQSIAIESFDDQDELDDESLLSALQDVDSELANGEHETTTDCRSEMTLLEAGASTKVTAMTMDEPIDWDDFLESGTQISRELTAPNVKPKVQEVQEQQLQRMSFDSSCSLGLTSQDIEALDPTPACVLSLARSAPRQTIESDRVRMPPPTTRPKRQAELQRKIIRPGSCATKAEFSLTQLEHFVDDDMTLSQI